MKKRITALALALVMVLGLAAVAAGEKNITVTPMNMTINGQAVTPLKSDGTPAEVFAYDGATYVPLRYLSEMRGVKVDWDANDPNTAKLTGEITLPSAGGDGAYTGTATGFGGPITAAVTVSGGKITACTLTGDKETPAIGGAALPKLEAQVVAAGSADIDGVSGATMTTAGVKAAVEAALAQAAGASAAKVSYTPGTYTAAAMGRNNLVNVTVTVSADKIESIEVGEHQETPGVSTPAIEQMPKRILDAQGLGVDAISGATATAAAIKSAVTDCLKQAGGNINLLMTIGVPSNVPGDPIEKTADVIVVGGGGAGLSSAISAAEAGASVILIEKTDVLGGNTIISGGAWNAYDPEMVAKTKTTGGQIDTLKGFLEEDEADYPEGYAETLKELKKEIREYLAGDTTTQFDSVNLHIIQCYQGGYRKALDGTPIYGDYDLIRNFCEQSLDALHWVQDKWGVEFKDSLSTVYGGLWSRGHTPVKSAGKGSCYFEAGRPYADKLGVEFMFRTTGKSIIMDNGKAVGIKAVQKDGTPVTLHANKGVVIATGGYGGSVELVKEYNTFWPALPEKLYTNNAPGITGDGIFMCRDVGADLVGMGFVQLMALDHPVTHSNTGPTPKVAETIFVNKEGKRFVNEYAARDVIAAAAFEQTDGIFYSIDDAKAVSNYSAAQLDSWVEQGYIWRADTIEELAKQIDIDPAVLAETVKTYNSYATAGKDPDFHKNVMSDVCEGGPYYATPHTPEVHHTMGGVHINTDCQIINTSGKVIPGLYAAGEVTGGIHAGNRLGGNAVADVFTHGRIAGASAAKGK